MPLAQQSVQFCLQLLYMLYSSHVGSIAHVNLFIHFIASYDHCRMAFDIIGIKWADCIEYTDCDV